MATVDAGTLRWGFEGDTSKLLEAHKQAQEAAKTTGESMAAAFQKASTDAGKAVDTFVTEAMSKLSKLAEVSKDGAAKFAEVWSQGKKGAEGAVAAGFASMNGLVDGFITKVAAKAGPAGALFGLAWSLGLKDVLMGKLDEFKPIIARQLDSMFDTELAKRIAADFSRGFEFTFSGADAGGFDWGALEGARSKIAEWAKAISDTIEKMVDGIRTALKRMAGDLDEITAAGKKGIDALEKQLDGLKRQYDLLGLNKREAAELRAEMDFMAATGKKIKDLSAADTRKLAELKEQIGEQTAMNEAERDAEKAIKDHDRAVQQLTQSMERQALMAERRVGLQGKTAYDRAMEQFEAQAQGTDRKAGAADDPDVVAKRQVDARRMQVAADKEFAENLARTAGEQEKAYDLQTRVLGQSAGETARLTFEHKELLAAQKAGVPITVELAEKIKNSGEVVAEAAAKAARAKEAFNDFMQVGKTVASSLESAFDKWINGSRETWAEFIKGLERDLAKLALRLALMPIFGGGGGASILGGLGNVLLPGRAEGGDVQGGQAYIVGEKQPELFIPRSSGTIVPSVGGAGGGNHTINMNINLEGANGDETIARLSAAAARQAAMQAVQQVNDSFPMRSRQFQMLGS